MKKPTPAAANSKTLVASQIAVLLGVGPTSVYKVLDAAGVQTSSRLPRSAFHKSGTAARYLRTEVQPVIDSYITRRQARIESLAAAAGQQAASEQAELASRAVSVVKTPQTPPAAAAAFPSYSHQPQLLDLDPIERQLRQLQVEIAQTERRMLERQAESTNYLADLIKSHNRALLAAIERQVDSVGTILGRVAPFAPSSPSAAVN